MKLIKTILILMVFTGAAAAGTYLPSEGNFDVSVWQTTKLLGTSMYCVKG